MLEAIFLGIVQGLTEFLPISSSAHVRIFGEFLPSGSDPGATFTAIMQIGTEIAVLIYFRNEIRGIIKAAFKFLAGTRFERGTDEYQSARLAGLITIGSVPIFLLGYLGQSYIRENFRSLWLISFTLIFFGVLLGLIDHFGKKVKAKSILVGGQDCLPGSAHFTDQAKGYLSGTFKDVLYYKNDVVKNAVRKYKPGSAVLK